MSDTAGLTAQPPVKKKFALPYAWHLAPDPHLQILNNYGFFDWLSQITNSESEEVVTVLLSSIRQFCTSQPELPELSPVTSPTKASREPSRSSWYSGSTNVSSTWPPILPSSVDTAQVNANLRKKSSTRCSTPSQLRPVCNSVPAQDHAIQSAPSSPLQSISSGLAAEVTMERNSSRISERSKKSDKVAYICTTGGCKDSDGEGIRSSHFRHERSHWYRYPCPLCHQTPYKLLRDIGCNCEDPPKSHWLHVEIHRLNFGMYGQKKTKFFTRRDQLEGHLQKKHDWPENEIRGLANEREYELRRVTACGICENQLFSNPQTMCEHLLQHVESGDTMEMWDDNRVIRNLLTGLPGLHQKWESAIKLYGRIDHTQLKWSQSDALRLRLELEARQLSDHELAEMAVFLVSFSETPAYAAGAPFPQLGSRADQITVSSRPGPKAKAFSGDPTSLQGNHSPIAFQDGGPLPEKASQGLSTQQGNVSFADSSEFDSTRHGIASTLDIDTMDCSNETTTQGPLSFSFDPFEMSFMDDLDSKTF